MSSKPLAKKAKTVTDAAPPSVSGGGVHFTPELIARMATFADANFSPDVMNICLAVGPDVSRTIKYCYLKRNQRYLIDTLNSLLGIRSRKLFDVEPPRREKAGTNHRAWMEVNTDWKTTAVKDEEIITMRNTRSLIDMYPFGAFNSATLAVELGLLEVVKFLMEEKGVDPNEYGWTFGRGSIYRDSVGHEHREHLLSVAMTFRRENIFQYLLSLPSTNLYSEIDRFHGSEARYGLFEQALGIYVACNGAEAYLTSFVNHNQFDVNRACHRYANFSASNISCHLLALYDLEICLRDFDQSYGSDTNGPWSCPRCTFNNTVNIGSSDQCEMCDTPRPAKKHCLSQNLGDEFTERDYDRLNRYVDAIKLLLEAGANPAHPVLNGGDENGIGFIERELLGARNIGDNFIRHVRERFYRQVITIMKDTNAP